MMTHKNFQENLNILINKGKGNIGLAVNRGQLTVADMASVLTAAATALGSDTTKHSIEIDTPAASLKPNLGR